MSLCSGISTLRPTTDRHRPGRAHLLGHHLELLHVFLRQLKLASFRKAAALPREEHVVQRLRIPLRRLK